jgi:hypothetical protein
VAAKLRRSPERGFSHERHLLELVASVRLAVRIAVGVAMKVAISLLSASAG